MNIKKQYVVYEGFWFRVFYKFQDCKLDDLYQLICWDMIELSKNLFVLYII